MIYIKHGTPDNFEDYPMEPYSYPYQIWSYYRGGNIVELVFIDENHDGDYRLRYPIDGYNLKSDFYREN